MDFVSVRVITHDVERLATFWEQVTGLNFRGAPSGKPHRHITPAHPELADLRVVHPAANKRNRRAESAFRAVPGLESDHSL